MADALIKTGTFGVHLVKNPAGTFSFTGSVPVGIGGPFKTENAGISALFDWVLSRETAPERKELACNMRADIFVQFMSYQNVEGGGQ